MTIIDSIRIKVLDGLDLVQAHYGKLVFLIAAGVAAGWQVGNMVESLVPSAGGWGFWGSVAAALAANGWAGLAKKD